MIDHDLPTIHGEAVSRSLQIVQVCERKTEAANKICGFVWKSGPQKVIISPF